MMTCERRLFDRFCLIAVIVYPMMLWKRESVTCMSFMIINVCCGSTVLQKERFPQGKLVYSEVRELHNQGGKKGALNRSIFVFYLALFELMFGAVNDFFPIKVEKAFYCKRQI